MELNSLVDSKLASGAALSSSGTGVSTDVSI